MKFRVYERVRERAWARAVNALSLLPPRFAFFAFIHAMSAWRGAIKFYRECRWNAQKRPSSNSPSENDRGITRDFLRRRPRVIKRLQRLLTTSELYIQHEYRIACTSDREPATRTPPCWVIVARKVVVDESHGSNESLDAVIKKRIQKKMTE